MKLSTRARYGVRLMLSLAHTGNSGIRTIKDIAREQGISAKYLGQIIITLKAEGLVSAVRGARGGYRLARPSSKIRLSEIVEPLEGGLYLVDCVARPAACRRSSLCRVREVWTTTGRLIRSHLSSITLADLQKQSVRPQRIPRRSQ